MPERSTEQRMQEALRRARVRRAVTRAQALAPDGTPIGEPFEVHDVQITTTASLDDEIPVVYTNTDSNSQVTINMTVVPEVVRTAANVRSTPSRRRNAQPDPAHVLLMSELSPGIIR